tara:strand:- start:64 stop:612 length:549 start_codon:yes stop_codon:yes gene_type:complete
MYLIKRIFFTIFFFILLCKNSVANDNLNLLFEKLNSANDIRTAEKIEKSIWNVWITHPKSEYLTNKLENATFSMNNRQYQLALKLFTDVIEEDPIWAEAWNKRATLLFLMGNYRESLKDIEKVLNLEPRHFGALSGRAQIYLSFKEYEKAVIDLEKARSIYPMIKNDNTIKMIKKLIKELQI